MKKFLAILLTFCMIFSSLPYVSSAVTYSNYDTLFSAYATIGFSYSYTDKMTVSIEKIEAYPYYHLTAAAGSYANSDLIFSLKPLNIIMDEYPIVKLNYRTDSPSSILDVSLISPKGETWMKTHPSITADGEWNSLTFDYRDINGAGSDYTPDAGETNITLRFKPFGKQTFTLESDSYFDINYVAFFKTQEEADAFEYNSLTSKQYEYTILTPEALYSGYGGSIASSSNFQRIDIDNSFIRYIAEPGTYNNNQLVISFSHDAFPLIERPYVKIMYRTDSSYQKLDLSIISDKGENWPKSKPSMINDGSFNSIIFSINDMTGNASVEAPDSSSNITVRLKPWGAHDRTLYSSSYFDIAYVGFFETEAEAEAYEYKGDSSYPFVFSSCFIEPDYGYAPISTVRKYIDEADERKNEIIHTNNTVPYEDHLSFNGLSGEYISSDKKNNGTSEYKLTAPAGSYNNGDGFISFTQSDVSLSDFSHIKLSYKTDISSDAVLTLKSSAGSASQTFTLEASGTSYKKAVFSLSDFNNYSSIISASNVSIEIAPFGTGSRTLDTDAHFSIEYIGLFKTRAAANNFEYTGENGANMTSNAVVYGAELLDPSNTASGRLFFVSSDGSDSDSNYGNNPSDPISLTRLIALGSYVNSGSTVYFKRGDTFRTTKTFSTRGDVTYTSYGYGDKPKINAAIDGVGSDKWSKTEFDNVWLFNETLSGLSNDVGHIRINGGELWGIKVSAKNYVDDRVNNGYVYNGRTYIEAYDGLIEGGKGLVHDLEFWHDYANGKLYLYCADGNPGEVFNSIEIANKGNAFGGSMVNTVVDNLYITGAGSHGLGYGNITDSAVTNCQLEWIGGSIQTLSLSGTVTTGAIPVRFGNAIESYGSAINFTIANCYCNQIYDCCYTVQNQGAVTFDGVFMYDNVAEYSNSGLEVWQSGGITNNMYLHDNYTLYGGYGWSHQRPNKDGNFFYGGKSIRSTTFTNCSVENNVNVLASSVALLVSELGSVRYNFNHNVYIMGENKTYTRAPINTEGYGAVSNISYNYTNIKNVVSRGTDAGSQFYFVPTDTMQIGDDPYEIFSISEKPIYDIVTPKSKITLMIGETYTMETEFLPVDTTNAELYFSSSSPLVASVDQDGFIAAHYPGTTTVSVISVETGVSAKMTVCVTNYIDVKELWSTDTSEDSAEYNDILFIGDSFFQGDNSVTDKLEELYYINSEKITDDSISIAGDSNTVSSVLEQSTTDPDIILISAGYNDYLAGTSIDNFKSALDDTFSKARNLHPNSAIAYVAPYDLTAQTNSAGLTLGDYVSAAEEIAEACGIAFADMYASPSTHFTLRDRNGNPGEVLTKYIDYSNHTTDIGAKAFAEDLTALLENARAIKVSGKHIYKYLYTANMLGDMTAVQNRFTSPALVKDNSRTYMRISPTAEGTSNDNTYLQINIGESKFKIKEYPVVKIYYRSNIADSESKIDLNAGVIAGGATTRLWAGTKYQYDKTGTLSTMTFNLAEILSGGEKLSSLSEADDDSPIVYLRIKPYHDTRTMYISDYFDILSVTFYATEADAENDVSGDVQSLLRGDVDGNGRVDPIDNVTLARYFASWTGYDNINYEVADINYNGYVNPIDSVSLSRFFASWSGYTDILD